MLRERWLSLMAELGCESHGETCDRLIAAYSEPHRHYHTIDHLHACLRELEGVRGLAQFPEEVAIALWFHDAIYSPTAADNEQRSGEWAAQFLTTTGVAQSVCQRVYQHILATRHHEPPLAGDAALVVDIDLAILGQPPEIYAAFERNIRREYHWVPWEIYRCKRSEILQSFLDRPFLYTLPHFQVRYEESARRNLQAAIQELNLQDVNPLQG